MGLVRNNFCLQEETTVLVLRNIVRYSCCKMIVVALLAMPSCSQPFCLSEDNSHTYQNTNTNFLAINIRLTIDFMEMDFTNLIYDVFIVESDKSKPTVTIGDFIISQHSFLDLAKLFKICADIFQASSSRQSCEETVLFSIHSNTCFLCLIKIILTADKDLFGSHYKFWIGFSWHSHFWFNKFPIKLVH